MLKSKISLATAMAVVLVLLGTAVAVPASADAPSPPVAQNIGIGTADSVAVLDDGTIVAVGTENLDPQLQARGRLIDASGTPLGQPFVLSEGQQLRAFEPRVIALPGSHFVVVWQVSDPTTDPQGSLVARLFDHDGTPLSHDVVLATGVQGTSLGFTPAAHLVDGGIALAWINSYNRTVTKTFDADLTPRGGGFESAAAGPSVWAVPDGNYVLSGFPDDFLLRPDGRLITPISRLGSSFDRTDVVGLADGTMVVVGLSSSSTGPDTVLVERHHLAGSPVGPPVSISNPERNSYEPHVGRLSGGGFAVTWITYLEGLYVQSFNADGSSRGPAQLLAPPGPLNLEQPGVTPTTGNGVVVDWTRNTYAGFTSVVTGDPVAADQDLVRAAYPLILGRPVDDGGLAYWTDQLTHGLGAQRFTATLARSTEARQRLVAAYYQQAFLRAPDPGGLAYWTDQLLRTGQADVLQARLLSSPEAYLHQDSKPQYAIEAFYEAYLQRQGEPDGVAFWTKALTKLGNDPAGRYGIAQFGFDRSPEHLANAINGASQRACGHPPLTLAQTGPLLDAYQRNHHDPIALDAVALATECSPAP